MSPGRTGLPRRRRYRRRGGQPSRAERCTCSARSAATAASASSTTIWLFLVRPRWVPTAARTCRAGRGVPVVRGQPSTCMVRGRRHRHESDSGVPEGGAVEQLRQRVQQRAVGAPVGAEGRLHRPRLVGGFEVGVHIGAAEGVDRLLGVGHEDQARRVLRIAEQRGEELPLDRIGVLELVDEGHPEAAAQAGGRAGTGAQPVPELCQHVVEGEGALGASSSVDLVDHTVDQSTEARRGRRRLGLVGTRDDVNARVAEDLDDRTLERPQPGEFLDRRRFEERFGGQDVGADGDNELIGVVDQRGVEITGRSRAEGGEHSLGEAVDGGDGGGVEADHRLFESMEALLAVLASQVRKKRIVAELVWWPLEGIDGLGQAGSHPVAQLGRRGPGEGDDKDLVDGDSGFGDVAHHQARQGVRLAGARARFDGRPTTRQRVEEGKDRRGGHGRSSALAVMASHR